MFAWIASRYLTTAIREQRSTTMEKRFENQFTQNVRYTSSSILIGFSIKFVGILYYDNSTCYWYFIERPYRRLKFFYVIYNCKYVRHAKIRENIVRNWYSWISVDTQNCSVNIICDATVLTTFSNMYPCISFF